jgi:hypothetical protein
MARHKLIVIYDDKLDQFALGKDPKGITKQVSDALEALSGMCKDLNGGVWADWA